MWRRNRVRIAAMFSNEGEIRRGIDTINAIESVNSVICKATPRHRMFPDDEVCHEGGLASDYGCVQKMDHADPEEEISLRYRLFVQWVFPDEKHTDSLGNSDRQHV